MKAASESMQALLLSTDKGTWNKFRIRICKYFKICELGLPIPPGGLLGPTRKVDFLCSSSSFPWSCCRQLETFCWNWCICNWCRLPPPRSTSFTMKKIAKIGTKISLKYVLQCHLFDFFQAKSNCCRHNYFFLFYLAVEWLLLHDRPRKKCPLRIRFPLRRSEIERFSKSDLYPILKVQK